MAEAFEYLKKTFPKKYREIVLEHQAVNKVITFCDDKNQYFYLLVCSQRSMVVKVFPKN